MHLSKITSILLFSFALLLPASLQAGPGKVKKQSPNYAHRTASSIQHSNPELDIAEKFNRSHTFIIDRDSIQAAIAANLEAEKRILEAEQQRLQAEKLKREAQKRIAEGRNPILLPPKAQHINVAFNKNPDRAINLIETSTPNNIAPSGPMPVHGYWIQNPESSQQRDYNELPNIGIIRN